MSWTDDYYVGSSDYPRTGDDEVNALLDDWADAYTRIEDVGEEA